MSRITGSSEKKFFSTNDTLTAKGVAISLMFFYHLFHEVETVDSLGVIYDPLPKELFLIFSKFGNICVSIFVFLTSYGISRQIQTMGWRKKDENKKTWKRFFNLMFRFAFRYIILNLCLFPWFNYKSVYGEGPQGLLCMLTDMVGLAELFGTPSLDMTWWYMTLAYLLIFIVPIFFELSQKTGWLLIPIGIFLPLAFNVDKYNYMYFMVMIWGICAARENWLDRILAWNIPYIVKAGFCFLAVVVGVFVRQNYLVHEQYTFVTEGIFAILMCMTAAILFTNCPVLGKILQFLGKYSMTMYIIHTFVYLIIFRDFIYSFRYSGLIWLVLLLICLAVSFLIDQLYNLMKKLLQKGAELFIKELYD